MFWFITCKGDILLEYNGEQWSIPQADTPPIRTTRRQQPLPDIDGKQCMGIAIETPIPPSERMSMFPLRQTFPLLPPEHYRMAGKATELAWFDTTTRFCGVCGAPMRWHTEISKRCTECGKEVFPQLATAIIVRVERGDEILLVRARNFRGDFYGLVAGFVETGESLEECVRREVREETGIEITDIRYFDSQAWPFPCGLMVGFTARYAGGDIHLQHSELSSGGWFRRDNLPAIPDNASIARRLIDSWRES